MLSNKEFTWDGMGLTDLSPVCGPSERISVLKVDAAIGKMKQGKSDCPIVQQGWCRRCSRLQVKLVHCG